MDEIQKIFDLLEKWRKFPKYQLERRLDIFFALYLPEILEKELHLNKDKMLILPEFPLKKLNDEKAEKKNNSSNNADFAVFYNNGGKIDLYLIELKTDMNSIDNLKQIKYYQTASENSIKKFLEDIIKIQQSKNMPKQRREKYDNLLEELNEYVEEEQKSEKEDKRYQKRKWKVKKDVKLNEKPQIIYIVPEKLDETKEYAKEINKIENKKIIKFEYILPILREDICDKIAIQFADLLEEIESKEKTNAN